MIGGFKIECKIAASHRRVCEDVGGIKETGIACTNGLTCVELLGITSTGVSISLLGNDRLSCVEVAFIVVTFWFGCTKMAPIVATLWLGCVEVAATVVTLCFEPDIAPIKVDKT